jgi:pyridoxine 4-dehydrogenase
VLAASSPDELIQAVHDNLRNLDVDVLDVVNLRNMFDDADRAGASIEAGLTMLADLQRQGLVRHIGLSNVTPAQISAGRQICDIVCVQNRYNATTAQVALAWLLRRAPNMLLIPGTSSVAHLRENISAAELTLPDTALEALGRVASIAVNSSERD